MTPEIKNKLQYLIMLKKNPASDQNAIAKIRQELEWINVAQFTAQDMQLLNQALD